MKLNKLLCAVATTGILTAAFAASVSAATASEKEFYTIGNPVDAIEFSEVSEIKSGDRIAFPVDINTSTGDLNSFTFVVNYNAALTPNITATKAERGEIATHGVIDNDDADTSKRFAVQVVGTTYDADEEEYTAKKGQTIATSDYKGTLVQYVKTFDENVTVDASKPEFYLLFTAKADIDLTKLNVKLLELEGEYSNINLTTEEALENPVGNGGKANACAGAFKITIDSTTVPKYVHALYVSFDDGTTKQAINQYVTSDDKTYDFPVRVKSTKSGSVTAKLYADLGTTADAVSDAGVEIGTVNVDLSGTATDYAAASVTVPKE